AVICSIAFSGLVWILIGIFARIPLLHFCGWAYMIMAYTIFIQWIHPDPHWYVLQLYTIPVFIALYIWGYKRLALDRVNGLLLIVIASLFFFIPEVYGFV